MMQTESKSCPACGYEMAADTSQCIRCAFDFESAPYPSAFAPRTNLLAVGALVLAILWLFGIGSIAAVLVGRTALRRVESSRDRESGRGLALAAIVLGALGIVAALVAVPVLLST
jgi:hypothetical protein